jgi:hypothetical protein
MYMKIHRNVAGDEVVAVCDRELLNTSVSSGNIEIHISEPFYGGSLSTEDEVSKVLRKAGNVNIMGERSVALAVRLGLVDKNGCIRIGPVLHAQIIRL